MMEREKLPQLLREHKGELQEVRGKVPGGIRLRSPGRSGAGERCGYPGGVRSPRPCGPFQNGGTQGVP